MSARPCAVGGRLAVPSVCIAAEPRWVGQALPVLGDRVAQSEKLQAQRLQFERRLRLCDPEVATRSRKPALVLGLNANHNHVLKAVCKEAAVTALTHPGPLQDCYTTRIAQGMKPELARLTL